MNDTSRAAQFRIFPIRQVDVYREVLRQLDDIESDVNKMKMPLAFADQFYVLRDHIDFVRGRYSGSGGPPLTQ